MKKNQINLIQYIKSAIKECKDDYVFAHVKLQLSKILKEVENVDKKRTRNNNVTRHYEEESRKKQEKWQESLKKGIKKLLEGGNDENS